MTAKRKESIMKISLCIPMYNENSIIADTARTLSDYMSATFEDYEILFSNDSTKGKVAMRNGTPVFTADTAAT